MGSAQSFSIPVHSAYLLPEQEMVLQASNGGSQYAWTSTKTQLRFYTQLADTGTLRIRLALVPLQQPLTLQVQVGKQKTVTVRVPAKQHYVSLGKFHPDQAGFLSIQLAALRLPAKGLLVKSLELEGTAAAGMKANTKERRNAASVHLRYPLADSIRAIAFYDEVKVPKGYDPVHSYYMATGFSRGYFGIQVNSATERRVIFSIWDAGNEAVDRSKVPDSLKVQLLAKGDGVVANDFGNEGTGGHSHWVYPWQTDSTYRFLVTALPDSATATTIYTGYFYIPETQRWKLIAAFRAPKDGNRLNRLYSFSENFSGENGYLKRRAYYGNQWVQQDNGRWIELKEAIFTTDATGRAGDRTDIGAGVEGQSFYLWHGGFEPANAVQQQQFQREPSGKAPVINWFKDADSLVQAQRDYSLIAASVASGKIDTTGSVEHVYYQLLQQGTGDYVSVTDTVTVHYKGYLLSDGTIFDQTKDKPARFPLRRLIRGWQLVLPKCRVGGRIRVIIPSAMAYSIRTRSKDIPPNSVLAFDIEVVKTERGGNGE